MSSYSLHRTEVFKQTGSTGKPVILVCLQNMTDRELIEQYLSDRYEVIVSDYDLTGQEFDLCIIDRISFKQNQQELIAYKKAKAPIIVPFLLFVTEKNWSRTIDPIWEIVDDVIPIPTPTPILISRIERMLQTRKYSLELEEKNKQLSMYEQAINATNAGLTITDATKEDNPIIFANEGFKKLTGYKKDEILGRNCRFLQEGDREQDALDQVRSLIAEGKEGHAALRNYKKDGTPFWNELSIAPITDEEGNITHFVGIQNDVTELIEVQEKLEEEKERYRLITENSTDMISRHAPDGTYLYASPASERLFGYSPEELVGESLYTHIHPDDHEKIKQAIQFVLQSSEKESVIFRKKTKGGDYIWVETTGKAIQDPKTGETVEFQASTRDVSERKQYEQELEEEKGFIDATVENMPGIFFMLDEDLNFIQWNKNLEDELGYTHAEMEEMHPMDFFGEKDQEGIQNRIAEILQSGHSEVEVDVLSKSGEAYRYYLIGSRLMRYGKQFIVGSGVNTTQRVEAELKSEQQKMLLSAVINQTESIIYVKDQEGRYKLVNDRHLDLLGLSREEVIGKTDAELFDTEFAREVMANDEKVLKTGKAMEFEEELQVGGETIKYLSIKNTLKGIPGFENCICGISTDITEREKAYHQLQERNKEKNCLYSIGSLNEKYQSIDKILHEAVSIIPGGFQYPGIAEAAIEYDGEIYATPGFNHTKWGLIAESRNTKTKTVAIKVVYLEERPQQDHGPFMREERELIDAIADSLASQIERITSREKLIESEKRWEQLVRKNPGLVQIIDGDEIRFINPAGANLYGVDNADELIGRSWTDFVNFEEEDKKTVRQRIDKAMSGDLTPPKVYKAWTVDHKVEKFIELQSVPVHYKGKRVLMTVGQEVTERVKFQEQLQQSLQEKEILLQEIHHRVKNNLAVISGLLQIQRFNSEDESLNKALSDSEMRIKSMALIHEKLYRADSLSDIDFSIYIEDLLSTIERTVKTGEHISIKLNCDSVTLNVNQAVPCALILNELISNAMEHGFKNRDEGQISIELKEKDNKVFVKVSDNGVGLPEDFDPDNMHSMGFTIINTLLNQLNASFEVSNEKGAGFSYSFEKRVIKGSSSNLV